MEYTKEWVYNRAREYAQSLMADKGEIRLMLFAHNAKGDVLAFPLNEAWGGPAFMRDIAILAVTAEMKKKDALCYAVISEAWIVETKATKGESLTMAEATKRLGAPPSEHPDRKEVVTVVAGDATGTTAGLWYIKRKPNGAFSHLEEPTPIRGEIPLSEGRFVDLLMDKRQAH